MKELRLVDLCAEFLKWMERQVEAGRSRPRTLAYYQDHLRDLCRALGAELVQRLIPLDLDRQCRTWHQIQAIQRVFNWAMQMELVQKNPAAKLKRPPAGRRKRILAPVEQARVLRSSRRHARRVLIFMRETICRPTEARELIWEDWRPEESLFAVGDFKAKERRQDGADYRFILLTPRAERLIARLHDRASEHGPPAGPVFLTSHKKPWTRNALRLCVRRVCRRLGLDAIDGEHIVPYTFRHTAATRATAAGMPDRVLADLMGHTNTQTTARYQHLQLDDLRRHLVQIRRRPG